MAAPLFSIWPGDGRPLYRQIVDQVRAAVASGRLRPGDKLPTHRDLARELVVAPLTVKKSYDLLQAQGLVVQEQGRGSFVAPSAVGTSPGAGKELEVRANALVHEARLLGMTVEELQRLIRRQWES